MSEFEFRRAKRGIQAFTIAKRNDMDYWILKNLQKVQVQFDPHSNQSLILITLELCTNLLMSNIVFYWFSTAFQKENPEKEQD